MKLILILFVSIVLVLITSNSAFAHAEKIYHLKGNIGKRQIAIKMLCFDEMPTRHIYYYYLDDKHDRYLTGKLQNGVWRFIPDEKGNSPSAKTAVTLNLTESNTNWEGAWIDSAGKNWDLVLRPIISDSIPSAYSSLMLVKEMDPYEHYRLSGMQLKKMKTQELTNNLMTDWFSENESGTSFFRLRSVNEKVKTDSINRTLEALHLSSILHAFKYNTERKTAVETTILYATNELLSFRIVTAVTPISVTNLPIKQFVNLDIASGQDVNLEELIWFDKPENKPAMTDLYKIYKYRKNTFAPQIFGLLRTLYPVQMKTDSCGIGNVESWALPSWNLTAKGIAFGFNGPDSCAVREWAIIPYRKFDAFLCKRYRLKPQVGVGKNAN